MGFVKQVHKPFGVTTERATELLGLSLAQVALPRGMQAPAGSAQPSPSRGHHIRSVRQAVLAGQSVSLLSALRAGKVSQPPASPRLCTAL